MNHQIPPIDLCRNGGFRLLLRGKSDQKTILWSKYDKELNVLTAMAFTKFSFLLVNTYLPREKDVAFECEITYLFLFATKSQHTNIIN